MTKPARALIYIANARLPTEKAYGYQIVKMCEAFALNQADPLLLHPFRYQRDPSLRGQSLFDFYQIPRVWREKVLPNIDVLRLVRFFPTRLGAVVYLAHAVLWGLYATLAVRRTPTELYYTRDAEVAFWLGRWGLPFVYEAHKVPRRAQRWLLRGFARACSLRQVIAITSFIRDGLIQIGFPADRILVLPDAVDLDLFEELPSQEACRQRLGLPRDRAIVGYIGRFQTQGMEKGIPELVRAMASLPAVRGAEPLLLCVGGPMEAVPAYRAIAGRCGVPLSCLQFVDRVPNRDVPFWIRACDVATVPWTWTEFSAYFTSPLKLFEYMAAGAPIVASDLPSLREVLRHDQNAWLVSPGDPAALGHALGHLLNDPAMAGRLADAARRDAKAYTWRQRAGVILDACRAKDSTSVGVDRPTHGAGL